MGWKEVRYRDVGTLGEVAIVRGADPGFRVAEAVGSPVRWGRWLRRRRVASRTVDPVSELSRYVEVFLPGTEKPLVSGFDEFCPTPPPPRERAVAF